MGGKHLLYMYHVGGGVLEQLVFMSRWHMDLATGRAESRL